MGRPAGVEDVSFVEVGDEGAEDLGEGGEGEEGATEHGWGIGGGLMLVMVINLFG